MITILLNLDTKLKEQLDNNQILNDNINDIKETIEKLEASAKAKRESKKKYKKNKHKRKR